MEPGSYTCSQIILPLILITSYIKVFYFLQESHAGLDKLTILLPGAGITEASLDAQV